MPANPRLKFYPDTRMPKPRALRFGACVNADPDLFFAETAADIKAAKAICADCPVAALCLDYALGQHEYGVWGGATPKERKAARGGKKFVPGYLIDDSNEAVSMLKMGMTAAEVGERFGVTERTVFRFKKEWQDWEAAQKLAA